MGPRKEPLDLEVAARHPRDEAPRTPPVGSRSTSPYTKAPTVDFDGLSWPSMHTRALS